MAWEGAFGVVPSECEGCYVSPEFPVFEVDTSRLAPEFLGFYFQNPSVWETASGRSTGTNVRRRRLNPAEFLEHEIPLPPLAEQRWVLALQAEGAALKRIQAERAAELDALLRAVFARALTGER